MNPLFTLERSIAETFGAYVDVPEPGQEDKNWVGYGHSVIPPAFYSLMRRKKAKNTGQIQWQDNGEGAAFEIVVDDKSGKLKAQETTPMSS